MRPKSSTSSHILSCSTHSEDGKTILSFFFVGDIQANNEDYHPFSSLPFPSSWMDFSSFFESTLSASSHIIFTWLSGVVASR